MLYDKRWDKTETAYPVYSLAGFVAWLEKQPGDKRYDWENVHGCIVCHYLNDRIGEKEWPRCHLLSKVFASDRQYYDIAQAKPHTFGAALHRARAAL